mgnify:CR=1 FL=1
MIYIILEPVKVIHLPYIIVIAFLDLVRHVTIKWTINKMIIMNTVKLVTILIVIYNNIIIIIKMTVVMLHRLY